jgi:hypothetical protein
MFVRKEEIMLPVVKKASTSILGRGSMVGENACLRHEALTAVQVVCGGTATRWGTSRLLTLPRRRHIHNGPNIRPYDAPAFLQVRELLRQIRLLNCLVIPKPLLHVLIPNNKLSAAFELHVRPVSSPQCTVRRPLAKAHSGARSPG